MSIDLWKRLKEYGNSNTLPMHMPGHKRNSSRFLWLNDLGCEMDITEIDGFDNLNDPEGILLEAEQQAAALWGADRSFFLVNGSSGGILAAIRAVLIQGGEVLLARNCHKSVYHGVELCGATAHFCRPDWDPQFGIFGSLDPKVVQENLDRYPKVRLVVLTSPTYDGVISDIASISRICHEHNALLLVDEAHGAHLGFGGFPESAIQLGADLVVQSLHKTMPSLTQTAILHVKSTGILPEQVARQIALFQTSSPSYLLISSIQGCVDYVENNRENVFDLWISGLKSFDLWINKLKYLQVLCHGADNIRKHGFYSYDPSKILVRCSKIGFTGKQLMELLREYCEIELEMYADDYALAMTGLGDDREGLERLAKALVKVDDLFSEMLRSDREFRRQMGKPEEMPESASAGFAAEEPSRPEQELAGYLPQEEPEVTGYIPLPESVMTILEAVSGNCICTDAENAVGQISGEYIWAYPPGIPYVIPGEVLSPELVNHFKYLQKRGVELHSTWGNFPERVFVCAKP